MEDRTATILQSLEYQSSQGRRELLPIRQSKLFWFVMACWFVPLLAGVTTFLLWVILRSDNFIGIGLLVIAVGTLLAIGGGIAALVLLADRWSKTDQKLQRAVLPSFMLVLLLLSNFLIAASLVYAVGSIGLSR